MGKDYGYIELIKSDNFQYFSTARILLRERNQNSLAEAILIDTVTKKHN